MNQARLNHTDPQRVALRLTGISKKLGGKEILRGVDLEAYDGEVVCIMGPSGGGKSTLLQCANLLITPDAGTITFCGENVEIPRHPRRETRTLTNPEIRRYRAQLGMVFQHFNLWSHRTVLENVIECPMRVLGSSRGAATARAYELLERVGVRGKANEYPDRLSGGEKQRVAIARALAMDPKVLMFDEATSSLDPERVVEVLDVIRELAADGRTMILVTHEVNLVREIADHVIFLEGGHIAEQGKPAEMFADGATTRFAQFAGSRLTK